MTPEELKHLHSFSTRGDYELDLEQPPPPCETEKCGLYQCCGYYKLACRAFKSYVYGRSKKPKAIDIPSKRMYDRVFAREEKSDGRTKRQDHGDLVG